MRCMSPGVLVLHQHITNWVKIFCVAKAPPFVVNFLQGSTAYLPRVMEMWPLLSNTILHSGFYFECVYVGGWRGRTHLFGHFWTFWLHHGKCRFQSYLEFTQLLAHSSYTGYRDKTVYPPYFPPTVFRPIQLSNTDEALELLVLFCHLKELTAIRKIFLNRM